MSDCSLFSFFCPPSCFSHHPPILLPSLSRAGTPFYLLSQQCHLPQCPLPSISLPLSSLNTNEKIIELDFDYFCLDSSTSPFAFEYLFWFLKSVGILSDNTDFLCSIWKQKWNGCITIPLWPQRSGAVVIYGISVHTAIAVRRPCGKGRNRKHQVMQAAFYNPDSIFTISM